MEYQLLFFLHPTSSTVVVLRCSVREGPNGERKVELSKDSKISLISAWMCVISTVKDRLSQHICTSRHIMLDLLVVACHYFCPLSSLYMTTASLVFCLYVVSFILQGSGDLSLLGRSDRLSRNVGKQLPTFAA
jgi:hypothetical protein